MLRTIFLIFAGLGLLLATLSVRAQQGPPDAGGVWVGYLGSGLGLELRLEQDGQGLSGSGVLQQADPKNPFFLDIGGEISNQGSALLQLQGSSASDNKDARFSLEVRFLGEEAEARLLDVNGSGSQTLTLRRRFRAHTPSEALPQLAKLWNNDVVPFSRYRPSEAYLIELSIFVYYFDSKGYFLSRAMQPLYLRVDLTGSLISEIAGSWLLEERDASRGVLLALNKSLTYREGRVSAWNYLLSDEYSRVIVKTPDTLSVLADLVFPRINSGIVGSRAFYTGDGDSNSGRYVRILLPGQELANKSGTHVTATLLRN